MNPNRDERKECDGERIDTEGKGGYLAGMGKEIVGWIKGGRERAGLTQEQAAKKWGFNRRTLEAWEAGIRFPRGEAFIRLTRILGPLEVPARGAAKRKRP